MRVLTAFALVLAGPATAFAQERPCPAGPGGATVVTESRSSFGPAQPCPGAPKAPLPVAPVPPRALSLADPPAGAAFPAGSLRAAAYNPGRPAPENLSAGQRVTAREYDDFDRLITETVDLEDGGQATLRYTYWRNGLRKTATDASGRVTFYEYDGRNLLSRVTVNQGLPD